MRNLETMFGSGRVLLADGAMGTLVAARAAKRGLGKSIDAEAVLLQAPEIIEEIHHDYVEAGADLLLTSTFSTTARHLEKRGGVSDIEPLLRSDIEPLLRTAAQCARTAAGEERLVFGDLGPIGAFFAPMGNLTREEAIASYKRRASILSATGLIDGLLIETQFDLQEVECGILGVREATDLPLAVTMSFDHHGKTMMGVGPQALAALAADNAVEMVGVNCGKSLQESLDALGEIQSAAPDLRLWAKPNAGLPSLQNGVAHYDLDPAIFAEWALRFAEQGASVFGGCCGTTPAHIRSAAQALTQRKR